MYRKLKLKSKKGALELSMNTIIIIVIGITLLILGLTFVTGTFAKLKKMVDDWLVPPPTVNPSSLTKSLTLSPESTSMKKGEDKTVHIYLKNMGDAEAKNVKTTVKSRSPNDVDCELYDTDAYNIKSGDTVDLKVLVQSQKTGATGNKFCDITVTGLGDNVKDALLVQVEAA
jgi:hypothetical protein